jgi:hypothetical protein
MTTTMTSPRLPNLGGDAVYLVLDGFGTFGQTDRKSDLRQPIGRPSWPSSCPASMSVSVALNTAERWARNVTAEIAQEVLALADQDLSCAVRDLVEGGR